MLSEILGGHEGLCRDEPAPAGSSQYDLVEVRVVYQVFCVVGPVVPYFHVEDAERFAAVCDQLGRGVWACRFGYEVSSPDRHILVVIP